MCGSEGSVRGRDNMHWPRLWSDSDTWSGAVLCGGDVSPRASLITTGTLPLSERGLTLCFPPAGLRGYDEWQRSASESGGDLRTCHEMRFLQLGLKGGGGGGFWASGQGLKVTSF